VITLISISVPAAFADVFTIDDITCHELGSPLPIPGPCDITTPSADVQFMLDTLLIPSPGAGTSGIPPFPPGVPGLSSETISPFFAIPAIPPPPITVPPTPPSTMSTITFTALRDTGIYKYSFGLCPTTATDPFNPVTQKREFMVACITTAMVNSNLVLFVDDGTVESFVGGDTTTITSCASGCDVIPGETVHFWLIPNNNVATFLGGTPPGSDFYPSQTDMDNFRVPFLMFDQANPGEFDQLLTFVGGGITLFTWEDKTRDDLIQPGASDQDFTDLAFKADVEFDPSCPNPPFTSIQDCLCRKFKQEEFCPIGGEFLAIDTSALLLAGLQTSAIWILPIVLAGAGTGLGIAAYHLRRK